MKKLLNKVEESARVLALAFFVGAAFALLEFAVYELAKPEPRPEWSFYLGATGLAYGVRGTWQLIAHKLFAFGWLMPAATAALGLASLPAYPLYRRLGLKPLAVGMALASGLALSIECLVAVASIESLPVKPPAPLCIFSFPAVALFISALFYLIYSSRPLARVAAWRWSPVAALVLFGVVTYASFQPLPDPRPVPPGPNVFIITVDALRADKVGPHGGKSLTPNIDRFAAGATTFRRCVVTAPWTLPSLASLHTGLYPEVHGAGPRASIDPDLETLAEIFEERGYDTAGIVANGFCEPRFGLAQGFRYYRSMEMFDGALGTRLYYTKLPLPFMNRMALYCVTTPTLERRVTEYLAGRPQRRRPFFLWMHFLDCHSPYTPPARLVSAEANAYRNSLNMDTPTAKDKRVAEELYDGEVRYVDEAVGRILARLDSLKLKRPTIVVVTADHGEEFWDHGGWEHGHRLYDELITVPFIMRVPPEAWPPARASGAVVDRQISMVDLYGTLAALCGIPLDQPVQSRSFAWWFRDRWSYENAFSSTPASGDLTRVAVTDGIMKFKYSMADHAGALYDLRTDPRELTPVDDATARRRYAEAINSWSASNQRLKRELGINVAEDEYVETQLRAMGYLR